MQSRTTDEIRKAYLDFFATKGHAIIAGASLVPENDPTVLFTTAGMHPLVPYLMGEAHPAGKRLCDAQLCVRTQDIDEVGDNTHLTCFEMMGNWSLGDYFKKDAIEMSFEFLTKILGIPLEKFAVTCFEGDSDAPRDDESAEIWKSLGVPAERIGYLPKAKNWWGPAGKTGPCGPDTEMFYWVGPSDLPPPGSNPATDDPNWMEIWNDVFMQYNKKEDGTFEPLVQQNVDTGMGLERVAAVLQKVSNVYETDSLQKILSKVLALRKSTAALTDSENKAARIITDHLKAATFMIADGVKPSNVDQGYVLRRLIRRAIRSARQLGLNAEQGLCSFVSSEVVATYASAYPKLRQKEDDIRSVLDGEEQQFSKALHEGQKQFDKLTEPLQKGQTIDGQSVFHLYDTYGFPVELTKEMATEKGLLIDEAGFTQAFEAHQKLSRAGAEKRFAGGLADTSDETTKLHTATHLLNQALRTVLGDHVYQKGSNITAERLRFDFSHPDKMTPEQIKKAEDLVNEAIKADAPISYSVMTVDEAKAQGAIGVFGDKYGEKVKVYTMGSSSTRPAASGQAGSGGQVFSKEICGGPHVARTGMLGSFKIQKEESSSSGVRRIKAIVSGGPVEVEVAGESA